MNKNINRIRLDKLLVKRGLCRSRSHAQEQIDLGHVEVILGSCWQVIKKSNYLLSQSHSVRIADNPLQHYVSRAALKLLGAFTKHPLTIKGMRVLDVGQSTGGFTQVLLEKGATEVVGIEVGHDQLAQSLRDDSRVICLESINARHLSTSLIKKIVDKEYCLDDLLLQQQVLSGLPVFDVAVMDVSFISQTLIVPELLKVLKPNGLVLALVKPQFEAGADAVDKKGLVRDESLFKKVEQKILDCYSHCNFEVIDYFPSPIEGSDGNREFFIYARSKNL